MSKKQQFSFLGLVALVILGFGVWFAHQKRQEKVANEALTQYVNHRMESHKALSVYSIFELDRSGLSYVKTLRTSRTSDRNETDNAVFDRRYQELQEQKKAGKLDHVDLVHFDSLVSDTGLASIKRISLTEWYLSYKNNQFQAKGGPSPVLDSYYVFKEGTQLNLEDTSRTLDRLTYSDIFSDGEAFESVAKEKMVSSGFTEAEAEVKLTELKENLDVGVFDPRVDRLVLNFDEERIYLEFPYSDIEAFLAEGILEEET
ncbi:hypothetical protein [Streptococcus moroccensis]|uniref:DUF4163 domain-containing protein n=1 Tax=Streptococcus moroccensis TaxID=1451356 RepID=A0ABT9YV93_9STRE|nr:hypothetical protein [Streptococcus moroccensis]MDQ0223248.1 hypothetical protein [Streptococcus moroccensis]